MFTSQSCAQFFIAITTANTAIATISVTNPARLYWIKMPASLFHENQDQLNQNIQGSPLEDNRALQLALELSMLGMIGEDDPQMNAAVDAEAARLKKSQNTTECVPVPSSEHVAEIVGRQGEQFFRLLSNNRFFRNRLFSRFFTRRVCRLFGQIQRQKFSELLVREIARVHRLARFWVTVQRSTSDRERKQVCVLAFGCFHN